MQSFISETLDDILKTKTSFEDSIFVLPSQRAGVFVKHILKNKIASGFLPEILTIEKFTERISGIHQIDTIQLLFHFYTVYKNIEKDKADSFENFSSWAFVILQDFNEIDQYLVDPQDIFTYLRDIQRLRKWSVKGEFQETELVKDHFAFMEKLSKYYAHLYDSLLEKKSGYQGLVYRESIKSVDLFIEKNSAKSFYFIGFNALNKSEEILFEKFLSTNSTQVYWDIDKTFYESNHSAGNFIRKYTTQWSYYEKNEPKTISNSFQTKKKIEILGGSKNIAQLKYAGQILDTFQNYNHTALILGDESLLPVALNSIPKKVPAINITMGYPLRSIPVSNFINSCFSLFINQEKYDKIAVNQFYYKDVIRFFKNSIILQILSVENESGLIDIEEQISKENRTFINWEQIEFYLMNCNKHFIQLCKTVFKPYLNVGDFIRRTLQFLEELKDNVSDLEKEYLYRFHSAFTQLKNLQNQFHYFGNLKTLFQFYQRVVSSEKLFFQGEPLQGLQLMGMLETRALDFENVIITSVNEQIIPSNNSQNSFIPFDVKIQFGLPTYKEKDAIFSYHFFRLLQRAKNIYLLYNTENDVFGSGEKSRFISQLEILRDDIEFKTITSEVYTEKIQLKEIQKNEAVFDQLQVLAVKGISPSTITNYLYNPIAFYKQKILKINELDLVEETVAANTLGTIVHDTLDELYQPFVGQYLLTENIDSMVKQAGNLVQKYFAKHFRKGETQTGKNRLIFEVANRYVERFLALEKAELKKGAQLKIIATEQTIETTVEISGIETPVKLKGIVDRIDELNGTTRIIDYKTGNVTAGDLRITDTSLIRDYKYSKAIQVLLYTLLYTKNSTANNPIEAGIYSFKNLKSGLLKVNFSSNYRKPDYGITQEKLEEASTEIFKIIQEIYNPEITFQEPIELPY